MNIRPKENHIQKFRRIHPRSTKGLSDEEVQILGDEITKIHDDETSRKFQDVFSDPSGQRYMIVNDGKEEVAIPLIKGGV